MIVLSMDLSITILGIIGQNLPKRDDVLQINKIDNFDPLVAGLGFQGHSNDLRTF